MARPGYLHLAANLTAADRRAAFTIEVGANVKNRDGKSPCVAVLRTDVAKADKAKGKVSTRASCVASFVAADRIATWDIKVVDEAAVKAKVTATVTATWFTDAAERLPVLSGKGCGDRVTINAKDDTLFLTNGEAKVISPCKVTVADDGNAIVQVDLGDLNRVVKGIASQVLTGPVIIGIDPTGIVKFDFTTKVGRFTFLVPTMLRDGRNPCHFTEFKPIPWAPAATPAAD